MVFSISYSDGQRFTERDVRRLINLGDQNQYEGNYQEVTKKYLQALEIIYQIPSDKIQDLGDQGNLTSIRATILAKLGDNLTYVGQYKIATEFYEQQLRTITSTASKLDIDFAYHKVGFGYYFRGSYKSSIELQEQSLNILSGKEDDLDSKRLKCKIYLCVGLNQCALNNHEMALNSYKKALDIAQQDGLQAEEAEIKLSSLTREELSLISGNVNKKIP